MARARAKLVAPQSGIAEVETLRHELDTLRQSELKLNATLQAMHAAQGAESLAQVVGTTVRWGCASVMAYFVYLSVGALAGKTSLADIGVRFLGDVSINMMLSWAVSLGGVVYGLRQRSLRRTVLRHLQRRTRELELLVESASWRPGKVAAAATGRLEE